MSDTEETPVALIAPSAADNTHPLDGVIASIRVAVGPDATAEARAVGATACRAILTALEAQAGQPLAAAGAAATVPAAPLPMSPIAGVLAQLAAMPRDKMFDVVKKLATSPRSPVSGVLAQLASMPREQLIGLINQQLRTLAPAGAPLRPPAGPRFHLIPIPAQSRRGGAP